MSRNASAQRWRCRDRVFDLEERPLVMGIVNVTPDSFSDGGRFLEPQAAIAQARRLIQEGADLIDLGAESTRPGAAPVESGEQLRRLMPVLETIAAETVVSVDTASAEVAAQAIAAGARVVNDVTALRDPAMAGVVAGAGAGVVLMHLRGTPAHMQDDPRYADVVGEVGMELASRFAAARRAGIDAETVVLDPGIGFAKTAAHNVALLGGLDRLTSLGRPLMVGVSRKSFLGMTLGLGTDERLEGGLAAASIAVFLGARIVRTHDVGATLRAVRIAHAMAAARSPSGGP